MFSIRLISGRRFTLSESGFDAGVAVVSESFVGEHLPSADAVDRRIRLERLAGDRWLRIVGVVADAPQYTGADARDLARVYVPFDAVEPRSHYVLYTAASGASGADRADEADRAYGVSAASASIRSVIASFDADIAVSGIFGRRSETRLSDVMACVSRIFETVGLLAVLGGFGAVTVAAIGLYGALSFEVQSRMPEIGLRMALGAAHGEVTRHMIRSGLWRVAPGLLIGFVLCAGISPLLGFLLGGMDPRDPFVYMGVYAGYLALTLSAMTIPARRAARLDPLRVLRRD